jgi:hypothetical protein
MQIKLNPTGCRDFAIDGYPDRTALRQNVPALEIAKRHRKRVRGDHPFVPRLKRGTPEASPPVLLTEHYDYREHKDVQGQDRDGYSPNLHPTYSSQCN